MTPRLAFVCGLRGASAQIWNGDQSGVNGQEPPTYGKPIDLPPGEEKWPLAALERIYLSQV